jgi:hypothetical protein
MSASACVGIQVYFANKRKFYIRPTKRQTAYYNENKTRRITVDKGRKKGKKSKKQRENANRRNNPTKQDSE